MATSSSSGAPSVLAIHHQGPHHVVVEKPSNTVVVRGRGAPRPTLLDMVQEQIGEGVRPVHRLDRGTTGCCIFAKTPFGQQALSEAFRRHVVDKRYLAVVEGIPEFKKLAIDARLLRIDAPDQKRGPLAWQTVDDAGQRALTRVQVLATDLENDRTLVEARLETGRMHQIRIHFAHVGHPIVGDTLYGHAGKPQAPHAFALHAFALSAPQPQGGRCFSTSTPSEVFAQYWLGDLDADIAPALHRFAKSQLAAERAEAAKAEASTSPGQRQASKTPSKTNATKKKRAQKKDERAPSKKTRFTDDKSSVAAPKRGQSRRMRDRGKGPKQPR